jgi:hypothetical protein
MPRALLILLLATTSLLKLHGFALGQPGAVSSIDVLAMILEVALVAILLCTRRFDAAVSGAAIAIALGGLAMGWLRERPCGCLGPFFRLDPWNHAMLASTLGLLAALTWLEAKSRSVTAAAAQ